jgi:hypothetical protein
MDVRMLLIGTGFPGEREGFLSKFDLSPRKLRGLFLMTDFMGWVSVGCFQKPSYI